MRPGGARGSRQASPRAATQRPGAAGGLARGAVRPRETQPGWFGVIPAGATDGVRWVQEHHYLLATLAPDLVAAVLLEVAGRPVGLIQRDCSDDPQARHLMLALWADVAGGRPSGRLYSDTLVRALVLRLVAGHADGRPWNMTPAALRQVREYIEAHLAENPSLAELAALAGLSPYYFARAFAGPSACRRTAIS